MQASAKSRQCKRTLREQIKQGTLTEGKAQYSYPPVKIACFVTKKKYFQCKNSYWRERPSTVTLLL